MAQGVGSDPHYSPIILISALPAAAVELPVENLLPGTEVEFARRSRDHDLPPHDLAFHMRIGVVLSGLVAVARNRLVRR
jgi:hypothetical protein